MGTRYLGLLLIHLILVACGCSHFDGHRFENQSVRYQVASPGWDRIYVDSADLAFIERDLAASLMINSHCVGVDDASLPVLTRHLFIGMTDAEIIEQNPLPVSNRDGLETVATVKLDGVPRTMKIMVVKKDGCVYDLVLTAPANTFESAVPAFDALRDGFQIGPRKDRF